MQPLLIAVESLVKEGIRIQTNDLHYHLFDSPKQIDFSNNLLVEHLIYGDET